MKDMSDFGFILFQSILDEIWTSTQPIDDSELRLNYAYRTLTDEIFEVIINYPKTVVGKLNPYLKKAVRIKKEIQRAMMHFGSEAQMSKITDRFTATCHCKLAYSMYEDMESIADFLLNFKSTPKSWQK